MLLCSEYLSNMGADQKRLCNVIKKIESLPSQLQEKSFNNLQAVDTTNIQEKDLAIICDTLREIIHKHKEFSYTKWALPPESVEKFYSLSQKFEPQNIIYRYACLFSVNP